MEALEKYNTQVQPVKEALRQLNIADQQTGLRQMEWGKTRQTLEGRLETLKNTTLTGWTVEPSVAIAGLESVSLVMPKRTTGIVRREPDTHAFNRKGGKLTFAQLSNGKVAVITTYPHIDGIGTPKPDKISDTVSPAMLTDETIYKYVVDFINDVIEWTNEGFSLNSH